VKFLRQLLLLVLTSALCGAIWVAHRPAAWSPLDAQPPARPPPLGVFDQISQASIKRSAPFEISEARLNQYLSEQVQPSLTPPHLRRWIQPATPTLALKEAFAELRLRWTIAGLHLTDLTVHLTIHREAQTFRVEVLKGAYGRLQVPRGLLHPVKQTLAQLATTLQPEIDALFQMNQIRIAEHKLQLDPRFTDVAVTP